MPLSSQWPHPQPGSGSALYDRLAFIPLRPSKKAQQSNNRRLVDEKVKQTWSFYKSFKVVKK